MGKLQVIVGGQYGSEAKGAVAAYLARLEDKPLMAVRVAGPNAGHTVIDDYGRTFKLRHIPVAAAVKPGAELALAAGSEIDKSVLVDEIIELEKAGYPIHPRLTVDAQATVLEHRHLLSERSLVDQIGSTGKGVGAARANRAMRNAELFGGSGRVAKKAREWLELSGTVQIEGTQGYGLGTHAGAYPKCTSSDCRAIDFLSMAGVSPWYAADLEVWVVLRTLPIRVAGDSGPLHGETTWGAFGLEPERTTVTNKVRRVGTWDKNLARDAVKANGGPSNTVHVALTGLDYIFPELKGKKTLNPEALEWVKTREAEVGQRFDLIGTGPACHFFR